MERTPKFSFTMIESRYGNKETSQLCIQVHVSYGMDTMIQIQGSIAESKIKQIIWVF